MNDDTQTDAVSIADHVPSEAAYRRHRRNGEDCAQCRAAHRIYVASKRHMKTGGDNA